jgi:hypothetical protein
VKRDGIPVVATGVAACAACCAAPVVGALGITVGLAALLWLTAGLLAAGIALLVGLAVIRRRRLAAA